MRIVKINCTRNEAKLTFENWKLRSPGRYKRVLKKKCEACGSTKWLQLHHLDGDKRNNRIKNLQTLCANCHRIVHQTDFQVKYLDSYVVLTHQKDD